jgi:chromosome segregation ATPase
MTDAPERIWARDVAPYGLDDLELGCWWHKPEYGDEVEYIRADLYDNTALKAAVDMMADEHGWVRRERLDALTEQLEAARADAKEAEAYAEELEESLRARTAERNHANDVTDAAIEEVNRLKALLATCEKYRDAYAECDRIGTQAVRDLETKLAKAVEVLTRLLATAHADDHDGWQDALKDARATLAEIEGEKK